MNESGHGRTPGVGMTQLGPSALWPVLLCCLVILAGPSAAQLTYDSGSTGIHGAFPPNQPSGTTAILLDMTTGQVTYCSTNPGSSADSCASPATTLGVEQLPNIPPGGLTTGIFEFTNVDIQRIGPIGAAAIYVYPVGNSYNQPLTILSQDDIILPQHFQLVAAGRTSPPPSPVQFALPGGKGGPGGYDGGAGSNASVLPIPFGGNPGAGPAGGAGGTYSDTLPAPLIGQSAGVTPVTASLTPIIGGSGGGGATGIQSGHPLGCVVNGIGFAGGSGGGGGGAVVLAASDVLSFGIDTNTSITVIGGNGTTAGAGPLCFHLGSGGGAGGSVRFVAREITGFGQLFMGGGTHGFGGANAAGGIGRFEAWVNSWVATIHGASSHTFRSSPLPAVPAVLPTLQITQIDGIPVVDPMGNLENPDVTLAAAPAGPVTVDLAASGIPVGTLVTVTVAGTIGDQEIVVSDPLAGTEAASAATASVDIPPGGSLVTAHTTFMLPAPLTELLSELPEMEGARPERLEVVAGLDGSSRVFAITADGVRKELQTGVRWQEWVAGLSTG